MVENNERNEAERKSMFNPAVLYLEGLTHLLDMFDSMMIRFMPREAYRYLKRVYGRVEHKLSEKERAEMQQGFQLGINFYNSFNPRDLEKLYRILEELDFKLKRLMDKYGLLMPSSQDPRFGWRQG